MRRPLAVNAAASFPTVVASATPSSSVATMPAMNVGSAGCAASAATTVAHVVDPVDAEVALRPVVVAGGDERGALGPQGQPPSGQRRGGGLHVGLAVVADAEGEELHQLAGEVLVGRPPGRLPAVEVDEHRRVDRDRAHEVGERAQAGATEEPDLSDHEAGDADLVGRAHEVPVPQPRHPVDQWLLRADHEVEPLLDGVDPGLRVLRVEGQLGVVPVGRRGLTGLAEQPVELRGGAAGGGRVQLVRVQSEAGAAMDPGDGAAIVHAAILPAGCEGTVKGLWSGAGRGERGAEEGEELRAQAPDPGHRRLPAHGPERLGLGRDPGHGGVGQRQHQPRVAGPQPPGRHLPPEVGHRVLDHGADAAEEQLGLLRVEPAHLPHQAEQGRPADGRAEGGLHHRLDPFERVVRRGPHGGLDRHPQLVGGVLEHGAQEVVLGGEPVEDGLLGHAHVRGDVVERHGLEPTAAELVERGLQDAVAGRASTSGHRSPLSAARAIRSLHSLIGTPFPRSLPNGRQSP